MITQETRPMNLHRSILATVILLSACLNVAAQDAPAPPPSQPRPSPPAAPAPPAEPAGNEPRTLEEIFIPSDEIAADEEVTFPINI
ncbi:MAG TPA: hypothetical protein VLD39_10815 [Gammaproteobacteria bacterium]|nr:hypothetical protein [Gammaproteobacteria bacterium]